MAWLTQNWPYLLLLLGVVALVSWRGGMGCGMAGHRRHEHSSGARDDPPGEQAPPADAASQQKGHPHGRGGHGCC